MTDRTSLFANFGILNPLDAQDSSEIARYDGQDPDSTIIQSGDSNAVAAQYDEIQDRVKREFIRFFETEAVHDEIKNVLLKNESRLIIPIHYIRDFHPDFPNLLVRKPFVFFPAAEEALSEVARSIVSSVAFSSSYVYWSKKQKERHGRISLGLTGWMGRNQVSPRGLGSGLANQLVCVCGIITRSSEPHAKLEESKHFFPDRQRTVTRTHVDIFSTHHDRKTYAQPVPKTDSEGHPVVSEDGWNIFSDFQRFTLQEMPEHTPSGQLPRSVEVIAAGDLAGSTAIRAGIKVCVYGLFRVQAYKEGDSVFGVGRSWLLANNIEPLQKEKLMPEITPSDIMEFNKIAKSPDTLSIVAAAIAPSIAGHDAVKRGLALQLVGGDAKTLTDDGTKLRGDIHVLLLGDPSCGKSQLLRFVMNLAPISVCTTGRGSSAVGLTAAVTIDPDTGERRLEAGAMVLADGGIVCIDEFDKMSQNDRVGIHEVMEQQTISIAKAGIQTRLNARTSVLAAANPIHGSFEDRIEMKSQIAFPDSLLSRFDLIYTIRDSSSAELDRKIAHQVLAQHRIAVHQTLAEVFSSSTQGPQKSSSILMHASTNTKLTRRNKTKAKTDIWITTPSGTGGLSTKTTKGPAISSGRALSSVFLRKYLSHAKHNKKPELTDAAIAQIVEFYGDLRHRFASAAALKEKASNSLPTARTLEACIRLATAHAKLKMQDEVLESDVKEAVSLLLFTLCGEVMDNNDNNDNDEEKENNRWRNKQTDFPDTSPISIRTPGTKRARESDDNDSVYLTPLTKSNVPSSKRRNTNCESSSSVPVDEVRLRQLQGICEEIQRSSNEAAWTIDKMLKKINKEHCKKSGINQFTKPEFMGLIESLQRSNHIMKVKDMLFLI